MKLIIKLLTLLVMLSTGLTSSAYDFEVDGICYNLNIEDKTVEVASNNGSYSGEIIIPPYVNFNSNQLAVTAIGSGAFANCSKLTKVELPNSIIEIRDRAFSGCRNLKSINIPASITKIEFFAFDDCLGLTRVNITDLESWLGIRFNLGLSVDNQGPCYEVTSNPLTYAHSLYLNGEEVTQIEVPKGVTSIKKGTFNSCYSLKSITLPSTIEEIEGYAFRDCKNLEKIEMPNTLSGIGESAFRYCESLANFEIPPFVNKIGKGAFSDCKNIKRIVIPNGVDDIKEYTFADCKNLVDIEIPNSVKSIRKSAFRGCGLRSLIIPSSVTHIEDYCFSDCTYLSNLIFEDGDNLLSFPISYAIGYYFSGCPIKNIYIGRNMSYNSGERYIPFYYNNDIEVITIGKWAENIDMLYGNDTDNSKFSNLSIINCCSEKPIDVPKFTNVQYATVQLNVPNGSLNAYKSHSIWGKFWNIQERDYGEKICPEDISLNRNESVIKINQQIQLEATINPEDAIINNITWASSDDNVATVSESGIVTGISLGEALITATCGGVIAECKITVSDESGVEDIVTDTMAKLTVYSIDGIVIMKDCTTSDLNNLPRGIYIVISKKKHYKIII